MSVDTNIDYYITVGDHGKVLHAILRDASRNPVSLADATSLKLRCAKNVTASPLFVGDCTKDPDQTTNAGQLTYTFAVGDVDTAGWYKAQFVITWPDKRLTFPTKALIFEITQELLTA